MTQTGKLIYTELQSIANGIGKFHNGDYIREQDAVDCVKDLIKSLRRENETCNIRRFLGQAQVLQEDLVPLIVYYGRADEELFEVTIRCLMNLTQPARIVFKNEVPQDQSTRHCYIQVEEYLQEYKQAFVNEQFLKVLSEKLAYFLELSWEERSEDQNVLIERLLVLLRNILHVAATDVDRLRTDDDASTHDQIVWQMHQTGLDKLILYIASSDDERRFAIHVLEIISLMFRDQTPEQLSSAGASRSRREKERDEQELARIADMERAKKQSQLLRLTTRHSRFGGTFVVKGMKSISDKDVIYHKPLSEVKQHSFDVGKKSRKTPKNRQPIEGEEVTRRSTLSIRVCLKEFCVEFIKNCYNPLMRAVKSALERESSQENDETYYLWSTRFFMQFQRLYHFDVELVRETVTVQEFNYVYRILLNHLDMMMVDRKDAIIWAKRLHLALRTFKELLETLQAMSNSRSSQVRNSAKVIQQNVFYMQEYRDLLPFLLKKFNNTRNSKLYAKDLVETTHIYVRAMEKWCATQGKVLVQRKRKVVKRRKAANTPISTETPQRSQEELEEKWNILSDELSDLLQDVQEVVSDDVTPFDATSEVSIDEQRLECVKSIYTALHSSECTKAIALLRAAREVWPDNGEFGALDISAEDEFMLLREVFLADLSQGQTEGNDNVEGDDYGDEVLEEEMEGVEEQEVTQELEFDFRKFLMTFSSPKVVQVYTLLLTLYRNNDGHTNHCIVKMLHRIAVQNGMVALLFQLSVFRTFQKIFNDDSTKTSHFAELKTFATYVLRQFFKCVEKTPKVYVEMLFWKNAKECVEIVDGYGTYKSQSARNFGKILWTEEQEMELKQLYEEHKDGEGDIVDNILPHLIDTSRTRRQVVRQLILMDLVTNSKQLKKGISGRQTNRQTWSEEAVEELRTLYEMHQHDDDVAGEIMLKLDRPRRHIVNKLVELGLVEDRKLLRKKRKRKSVQKEAGSSGGGDSSSSEEESDTELASAPTHPFSGLERGDPLELLSQLREMPSMELSLNWLRRSFNRTADDREDEDEEPEATPLIPLMEECEVALQNAVFQKFLYTVGVNPPVDEQEQFWRISLELSPGVLRQLDAALDPESGGEFPRLDLQYNIPSGSASRNGKCRKQKRVANAKPKATQRRKPAAKDSMELERPPKSKEFLSSDDTSSDSDSGVKLDTGLTRKGRVRAGTESKSDSDSG